MKLATEDYRALAVIAALLVSAGAARWLERPRPILENEPQLDLAALAEESRQQQAPPRSSSAKAPPEREKIELRPTERIDPNRATVAQLTKLPGVGAALAERIRAAAAVSPFRTQSDLLRVPGIGPAMIRKLAPLLTLPAGPPTPSKVAGTPVAGAGKAAGPASQSAAPVNLNRATAAELERIRGVGTVLAARILARRDSLGRFRDWAEVDAIAGVGTAMLDRLRAAAVLGN